MSPASNSLYVPTLVVWSENISPEICVDTHADKSFFDYLKRNIKAELCCKELWRSFHRLGTEMIITKAGSSQWIVAGSGEPPGSVSGEPQVYVHPDSPATGQLWMAQGVIAFDKVKLTNNRRPLVKGQIYVHSMHKYVPRIHVLPVVEHALPVLTKSCIDAAVTFTYPETVFITVTAYQNQQITRLKIASNPFAKGFREPPRTRIHVGSDRSFETPTCENASCQNSSNGFVSAFHQLKPKRREILETPLMYEVSAVPFSFPVKFIVHSQAGDSSQSKTVENHNTFQ